MLILLLPVLWLMFYILIPSVFKQMGDWRLRLIAAAALSGGCLVLLTEVLSLFQLLTQSILFVSWLGVILILGAVIVLRRKSYINTGVASHKASKFSLLEIVLLSAILILVLATGIISYVAAPNNWDSMLYHLARVAHWQQNHSVEFFPAHNLKQLAFSPFAEYTLLHFHVLSGTDQFDNLLQWWAMIISIIGVSYLAKRMGAPRSVQLFSALFVATLPMGIFQSSTTQNDYVLSAWVVSLVCFGFAYIEEQNIYNALIFGILLGLAIFTKATAYIYCFPVLLGLAYFARKTIFFKKFPHVLLIVFLAACLNLPFWLRNFNLFGNPLGPNDLSSLHVNEQFSLFGTGLNLFRNLGSNLMLPAVWADQLTDGLAAFLGTLKINLSDPRYTFPGYQYSLPGFVYEYTSVYPLHVVIRGPSASEDTIGNPLHLLVICLALLSFIVNRKKIVEKDWLFYVAFWFSMLVLISGYLRWQQFINRLLLPWFILAAPFVSMGIYYLFASGRFLAEPRGSDSYQQQKFSITVFLGRVRDLFRIHKPMTRRDWINSISLLLKKIFSPGFMLLLISALLIVCAIPLFYSNPTKPIWQDWNIFNTPRIWGTLRRLDLQSDYTAATDYIIEQNCHSIGLVGSGEEWEYPVWVLFRNKWGDSFRIENVLVENVSGEIKISGFDPCALLVIRPGEPDKISYNNVVYVRVLDLENADVYLP